MTDVYDFTAEKLEGGAAALSDWRGKVLLIVNTASQCGFTPQFAGLQKLHETLGPRGFEVLGFPCNQFREQEPGDAHAIGSFCERNYGVGFPMFAKIDVNGDDAHPLYKWLTGEARGILGQRKIFWNFTKFLIDRSGRPIRRFGTLTKPEAISPAIEKLL